MATSLDAIVDRVRSLCVAWPFEYRESARLDRFDWDAAQVFGDVSVFRIETVGQPGRGGSQFSEEQIDLLTISVGRAVNADYDGSRRALLRASRSLTSAVARDGAQNGGDYTVPDQGFRSTIEPDPTAAYLTLRLTLPINYEAQW